MQAELAVYDEVVERFGDSESPALLEAVARGTRQQRSHIHQSGSSGGCGGCL